jgi:alanyl-tRNA synthetase
VEALQTEVRTLSRELAKLTSASVTDQVGDLVRGAELVGGVRIVAKALPGATRDSLRDFADQLRDQHGPIALILAAVIDDKVSLIAAVSKELIKSKSLNASECVKAAAKVAGGGGGGRPDLAEAGAKLIDKLDDAVAAGAAWYRAALETSK